MFPSENKRWIKISALAVAIAIAAVMIYAVFGIYNMKPYSDIYILNDNWNIQWNDEGYENVSLNEFTFDPIKRGDKVVLTATMPDVECEQPYMKLRVWHSTIEVSLGEEVIYTFGQEEYADGQILGGGSRWFTLPDDFAGKELKIQLLVTENYSFTKFYDPMFGPSADMIFDFIRQNSFTAVTGMFLTVLGVVLLLFSAYTLFFNRDILQLLWIAMLSLSTGFWVLTRYGLLQMVSANSGLNYFIEYISLYSLIPFGLLSIYSIQDKRWKISRGFKILIVANIAYVPLILLLHFMKIVYVSEALKICHIFILVDSISIFYLCFKRRNIKTEQTKLIGILLFTGLSVLDLVMYQLGNSAREGVGEGHISFASIGAVVFIIVLLINYGMTSAHNFYIQAETTALQKLAYADQLTGLSNRTFTYELLMKYDSPKSQPYGMILFDLNDLKKTNDMYGHSVGDRLICAFADILKSSFQDIGSVARIGGDEFIVMLEAPSPDQVQEAVSVMQEKIRCYNQSQDVITVSAAWGIAYSWELEACDTDKLYKLVDEKMYVMKRGMKGERRQSLR